MSKIRKGQAPPPLQRAAFSARFQAHYSDPAFAAEAPALSRLEAIAWGALQEGRKAPRTQPAGRGFADGSHAISTESATARPASTAMRRWTVATRCSRKCATWLRPCRRCAPASSASPTRA